MKQLRLMLCAVTYVLKSYQLHYWENVEENWEFEVIFPNAG